MSSEEYDIRQSEKDVGQLYPVLIDKKGRVIDGLHRLNIDPSWRTVTLENIDSEEKFLKARIISNLHRRTVPASEIRAWINDLAEVAVTEHDIKPGRISDWIAEGTGYDYKTVLRYLDEKYKSKISVKGGKMRPRPERGLFKKAEEKLGRETFQQLKADLKEEAKQELSRDPKFIIETIEKAPVILPNLPKPVIDGEGYYVPIVTEKQAEEMKQILLETEKDLKERRSDPSVQERGKLVKNWMAHGSVLSVADSLKCPICGSDAHLLIWQCHPNLNIYESHKIIKDKLER